MMYRMDDFVFCYAYSNFGRTTGKRFDSFIRYIASSNSLIEQLRGQSSRLEHELDEKIKILIDSALDSILIPESSV